MSFETLWRSMYSDISSFTMALSLPKSVLARSFASWLLPTPVDPKKIKLPMGRSLPFSPARQRRTAEQSDFIAVCCPTMLSLSLSSSPVSLAASSCPISAQFMPVSDEITLSMCLFSSGMRFGRHSVMAVRYSSRVSLPFT